MILLVFIMMVLTAIVVGKILGRIIKRIDRIDEEFKAKSNVKEKKES